MKKQDLVPADELRVDLMVGQHHGRVDITKLKVMTEVREPYLKGKSQYS
jgi:hypothetical protein